MQLDRPLRVVTPTIDGDVLVVLARVTAEFTPPQVHALVGDHSLAGVRNALNRLAEQGIVDSRRRGNAVIYQLNRDHLAAEAVTELASQPDRLRFRLRERFDAWAVPARYAALFGSSVGGRMRADSDIDILVVRPDTVADDGPWADQLSTLTDDVSRWTGNDTRILEYSESELTSGLAAEERVLADIADMGVTLAGPDRYLTNSRRRGR